MRMGRNMNGLVGEHVENTKDHYHNARETNKNAWQALMRRAPQACGYSDVAWSSG